MSALLGVLAVALGIAARAWWCERGDAQFLRGQLEELRAIAQEAIDVVERRRGELDRKEAELQVVSCLLPRVDPKELH